MTQSQFRLSPNVFCTVSPPSLWPKAKKGAKSQISVLGKLLRSPLWKECHLQPLLFDRKMVVSAPVWLVIDRFTKRGMVQPSAVSSRSGWRRVRWKRSSRRLNWRENVRTKLSKLGRFQSLFLKRHAIQQSKPRNSTRWCVGACIGAALVR